MDDPYRITFDCTEGAAADLLRLHDQVSEQLARLAPGPRWMSVDVGLIDDTLVGIGAGVPGIEGPAILVAISRCDNNTLAEVLVSLAGLAKATMGYFDQTGLGLPVSQRLQALQYLGPWRPHPLILNPADAFEGHVDVEDVLPVAVAAADFGSDGELVDRSQDVVDQAVADGVDAEPLVEPKVLLDVALGQKATGTAVDEVKAALGCTLRGHDINLYVGPSATDPDGTGASRVQGVQHLTVREDPDGRRRITVTLRDMARPSVLDRMMDQGLVRDLTVDGRHPDHGGVVLSIDIDRAERVKTGRPGAPYRLAGPKVVTGA